MEPLHKLGTNDLDVNEFPYLILHSLDEIPPFEWYVDQFLPVVIPTIHSNLPLDEMLRKVDHRGSHDGQGIVMPWHTS